MLFIGLHSPSCLYRDSLTYLSVRGLKIAPRRADVNCASCERGSTRRKHTVYESITQKLGFKRYDPVAQALYQAAVTAARNEKYYTLWGVPDTVDGRFDMISLMVTLINRRIGLSNPKNIARIQDLAQELFDVMFKDIDINLRELGVSDEGMKHRIKPMASAHLGRVKAYTDVLGLVDEGDRLTQLTEALVRNIYRTVDDTSGAEALAARTIELSMELDGVPDEDILNGRFAFKNRD